MDNIHSRAESVHLANPYPEIQARATRPMIAKCLALFIVLGLLLCARSAQAAPTTTEQAMQVAQAWLSIQPKPLDTPLGNKISRVETFTDAQGQAAYYIAYLDPKGFLIVSADDMVEPIIGFLPEGKYDPSPANPLGALVSKDLPGRLTAIRQAQAAPPAARQAMSAAQNKWASLTQTASQPAPYTAVSMLSDVRVAPLVQSKWDQDLAGGGGSGGPACYNYYTPPGPAGSVSNYVCGCVATAMSQLMRYWQHPTTGIGVHSFSITVAGTPQTASTRGGDGNGGAYSWSQMPLVTSAGTTVAQCQAIGALCSDAGLTVNMDYNAASAGGSGASVLGGTQLASTFRYANAIEIDTFGSTMPNLTAMVNPNLDASCPCLLGIAGSGGGHAIVCDGYGYSSNTLYHHLNMGWSGQDNAWYNLPLIDASWIVFDIVDGCVFNTFPSGKGEIISGRVTDRNGNPISGATVIALATGGTSYSATTNAKGIYAVVHVPSATTFAVVVSGTYSSASQNVSTKTSSSGTNAAAVGNVWGVDFTAAPSGPPVAQFSATSFAANRDDGTAAITVSLTGSNAGGLSLSYSTADGSAIAGTDYTATSGVLTFQPYQTDATFNVPLASDLYDPATKTLSLVLSNPAGGLSLGTPSTATLTIAGSHTLPALSLVGVWQKEGNSGSSDFNFNASLSKRSILPVTITYQTSDNTAKAGQDYTPAGGTLTIPAGTSSATIPVPVIGNTIYEPNKAFMLNVTSITGGTLADSNAQGTIENDDPLPNITIEDTSGSAPAMAFDVKLSGASSLPVTVSYQTTDGTAVAGTQYTRTVGTLTVVPGQTSASIPVALRTADLHECDKTLYVTLSNPSGGFITRGHATGTVVCSVPMPTVSIEDGVDMGQFLSFQVRLSAGTDAPVTLGYVTADGTAVAGADYSPVGGSLIVPPGQRFTTIVVPIVARASQAKNLYLKTSVLGNASSSTPQATGVIQEASSGTGSSTITPSGAVNCGAGAGSATLLCCMWLGVMKWARGTVVIRRRR